MKAKRRISHFLYPTMVIAIGAYAMVAKKVPGFEGFELEGRFVMLIGALWCVLGVLGIFRAVREIRRGEEPNHPPENNARDVA